MAEAAIRSGETAIDIMSGDRSHQHAGWPIPGSRSATSACRSDVTTGLTWSAPQYIIGYGSLMETNSQRSTEPNSGINLPVRMTGLQRAWNTNVVYPTTFLGEQPSKSTQMVAALYRDFLKDRKLGADAREIDYCRAARLDRDA